MLRLRSLLTASTAAVCLLGTVGGSACAQEHARWLVSVGVYPVRPQEQPHADLDVGDGVAVAFEAAWMFTRQWGLALMAAAPVEHDLYVEGVGKAGALTHAPIALTLQRRFFDPNGRVQGYAGAGLARSAFFDERTYGPLEGAELDVEPAQGVTLQAGLELAVASDWFVALGARWFDFDGDAAINGGGVGVIELDPYMIGLALGRRLR